MKLYKAKQNDNDCRADFKMNTIVGILDMDGYVVNKKFYCRELEMLDVNKDTGTSWHFNTGLIWQDLSLKDQKCCTYVCRQIVKLEFNDYRALQLTHLPEIVKGFYNELKIAERSTYKGGHFEKELLQKLHIPAVNLETFGCPRADHIFNNMIWIETCGRHFGKNAHRHCPKTEVEAYGHWLKENQKNN